MKQNEISALLKARRKRLHLTQREVALRAGIHMNAYQFFEYGMRDIRTSSFTTSCRVLMTLHLDPLKFFLGYYHASEEKASHNSERRSEARSTVQSNAILRDMRVHLGLSQKEVAHNVGIGLSTYQKFERGERSLLTANFGTACAILETLHLDPKKYYDGRCTLSSDLCDEDLCEMSDQTKIT